MYKVLFLIFFLLSFWLENVYGFKLSTFPGLSLLNVSIIALFIIWSIVAVSRRHLFLPSVVNKYILLLFLVSLISIPIKLMLNEMEVSLLREFVDLKSWANPFLLFLIIYNIMEKREDAEKIIYCLLVFLLVTVVSMFPVGLGLFNLDAIEVVEETRIAGFAEPNQYASYLVLFMPILLSYAVFASGRMLKAVFVCLYILTFMGILATGSRGGLISFLASMIVYLSLVARHRMVSILPLIMLAVWILFLGSISYVLLPTGMKQKIEHRINPVQAADAAEYTSGRLAIWTNGFRLFLQSPVFGHGQSTFIALMKKRFGLRANSHNDYLLYAVHYGLTGLIVFVLMLGSIYRRIAFMLHQTSDRRDLRLYISYMAGFAGYAVAMFGVNIMQPRFFFWIFTAAVLRYGQLEAGQKEAPGS